MSNTFNFYCDESCHLLNDRQEVMTVGTVWCPAEKRREICVRLREIKARHKLSPQFEVKWGKISPAKAEFYLDWLDLFLDDDDLRFRAVVVPQKSKLHHDRGFPWRRFPDSVANVHRTCLSALFEDGRFRKPQVPGTERELPISSRD
ncbi:MAG: DUF3800 domain-containing protein [Planctomycetota bacterium]|jgi:hypothetical protein|nr:MAG: DUF3800 domain-containing protein [Planctomycetota bacterium]